MAPRKERGGEEEEEPGSVFWASKKGGRKRASSQAGDAIALGLGRREGRGLVG